MSAGSNKTPTRRTAAMPKICWKPIANVGVRCLGCILPKQAGSVPAQPIVYMTRDAELVPARPTATALLTRASTTNHQPAPQSA